MTNVLDLARLRNAEAERDLQKTLAAQKSPLTLKRHRREWLTFREHFSILPLERITEKDIAIYLNELGKQRTHHSLKAVLSGIRWGYREEKIPFPESECLVKGVMRGHRRIYGANAQSMTPIDRDAWLKIEKAYSFVYYKDRPFAKASRSHIKIRRGLALISVMRDTLCRISEAVELRWENIEQKHGEKDAVILVSKSKTDPCGEGRFAYLSKCTMKKLSFLEIRNDPRIFPIHQRTGYQIVSELAKGAGLKGRYGPHSVRRGAAVDLARFGAGVAEIQNEGGWETPTMATQYAKSEEKRRGAMARMRKAEASQ